MMKHLSILLTALTATTSHGFVTTSPLARSSTTTQRHLNNFFNFNKPDEEEKVEPEDTFQDAAYDEDDPVEKIFGFFFGKREEEPMGT
jgi:hypothetical protein